MLGEVFASLGGKVPPRSDGLQVWQRPVVDENFPPTVAVAIRRRATILDGMHAMRTSLQRLPTIYGSSRTDADWLPAPWEVALRLAAGAHARRTQRHWVSRGAVEAYAAYEKVNAGVQPGEEALAEAVDRYVDTLALEPTLTGALESIRPHAAAVLSAGVGLEKDFLQEDKLLGRLARRFPRNLSRNQRDQVRAYREQLAINRVVPSELSQKRHVFANDAIGEVLEEIWFGNDGQATGKWNELKNFMQRAGVIRVWDIPHVVSNLTARLQGKPGNLSRYRLVALPFMPVARLLGERETRASANVVLVREQAKRNISAYTVYKAVQTRQKAIEEEARILRELKTQSEFQVAEQPIGRAYVRHISRPVVRMSKPLVQAAASLMASIPFN